MPVRTQTNRSRPELVRIHGLFGAVHTPQSRKMDSRPGPRIAASNTGTGHSCTFGLLHQDMGEIH
jgi:hypothetical protein